MEIKVENGVARVYTPYNPDFVKAIKKIGGAKWDREKRCWAVPESAVDAAREIMKDVYGYNDSTQNETVKLKITAINELSELRSDVVLFGKVLSHATGRDSGARIGDDVAYVRGGATSGGSVKNWRSEVEAGSEIILSNVNKNLYGKAEPNEDITVELLAEAADRAKLLEEKERLLKRIEEIDRMLQEAEE